MGHLTLCPFETISIDGSPLFLRVHLNLFNNHTIVQSGSVDPCVCQVLNDVGFSKGHQIMVASVRLMKKEIVRRFEINLQDCHFRQMYRRPSADPFLATLIS